MKFDYSGRKESEMKQDEYITELKKLYEEAYEAKDFRLAWDLLEASRMAKEPTTVPESLGKRR